MNQPNYPMGVTAYDVEAYYDGQRESSAMDMLEPTCSECGNAEVMVAGLMCDECKAGVPDMSESHASALCSLVSIGGFFAVLLAILRAVCR